MENQNQTLNIETLRNDVAESVVRAYGAERRYADALNITFPFAWYDVEAHDKTETAKPVQTEKKALYDVLKKANHTNPSTVWARIRKYGREAIEGKVEHDTGNGNSESEADGEGNSRSLRDPLTRNIEELIALYKYNQRQDSLPQKVKDANVFIAKALESLGVNLNMVAE
jgi:hypothetical protein